MRQFSEFRTLNKLVFKTGRRGYQTSDFAPEDGTLCATCRRSPGTNSLTATDSNEAEWILLLSAAFTFIVQGQEYPSIRGDRRKKAPWGWREIYLKLLEPNLTNLWDVRSSFLSPFIIHSRVLCSRFFLPSDRHMMAILISALVRHVCIIWLWKINTSFIF